tara:strand:+ start:78 stop:653 length:576 start_codon:yes stop_codon:yes gene_type:complete
MSDIWEKETANAGAFDGFTTEAGSELSDLIRQVNGINKEVISGEEKVKGLKRKRDRYLYELIPDKMQELGVDSVEVDGNVVKLITFVSGTMPKDPLQKQAAMDHLRDIGYSDVIKNTLSVQFGRTQDNRAKDLYADLEEAGLNPDLGEKVEPSTLKKVLRDCIENGKKIDLEMFDNANLGTIAKLSVTKGS